MTRQELQLEAPCSSNHTLPSGHGLGAWSCLICSVAVGAQALLASCVGPSLIHTASLLPARLRVPPLVSPGLASLATALLPPIWRP